MLKTNKSIFVVLGIASALWLLSSLSIADRMVLSEIREIARRDQQGLNSQADYLVGNIKAHIQHLHNIPQFVGKEAGVLKALSLPIARATSSTRLVDQRKTTWSEDPFLKTTNRQLANLAAYMNAGVIFVLNASGDCILASNADEKDSFVGTDYRSRQYFSAAIEGRQGYQYAMGKVSNVPGLFFSSPIVDQGKIVGVAVVKINLADLSQWINQANAYLTDEYGVIVLAYDKSLEMRSVPDGTIGSLSTERRLERYKRTEFPSVIIEHWPHPDLPSVFYFVHDKRPILMTSRPMQEDLGIHVIQEFRPIANYDKESFKLFSVLASIGMLVLFLIVGSVVTVRNRLRVEKAIENSEARLRGAQQIAQLGSYDWNLVTGELQWSDEHFRLWGLEPQSVTPSYTLFRQGIHPDDVARTEEIVQQALRDGRVYECEHRVVWPDGSVHHIHLRGEVALGKAGQATQMVGTVQDITEHKAAENEIQQLAFSDPLTGLPNRRLLLDRLHQALAASARNIRQGALMLIDLDNFKTLNDTRGHDVGDQLLLQVAQRLGTCVRKGDTVARLGGDEFVVMLEDLSEPTQEAAEQAKIVGEKILATLNQPYRLASYEHHSTPSIGITLFGNRETSIDELLKQTDLAMYQAKAAGRNTLRFFDPEMQTVVFARAALESDLRQAVWQQQFLLHYQAQVDSSGRLIGVEALVRWQHPKRGMVSPADFIPFAEETGLILPLGHWVLETACRQLVAWATQPSMSHLTMAVNVSARQFSLPNFVEEVLALVDHTGANPQKLKLELTESLLLENAEDIVDKMVALKARGVGFALDDFGTGYSSLSYLKRLPLDQLKIDQSFVRNILTDPNDAAIAKMVVVLAESLGLTVIAEGVETEGQRDFLANNGCVTYQGYLFSRPLPIDDFEQFVQRVLFLSERTE